MQQLFQTYLELLKQNPVLALGAPALLGWLSMALRKVPAKIYGYLIDNFTTTYIVPNDTDAYILSIGLLEYVRQQTRVRSTTSSYIVTKPMDISYDIDQVNQMFGVELSQGKSVRWFAQPNNTTMLFWYNGMLHTVRYVTEKSQSSNTGSDDSGQSKTKPEQFLKIRMFTKDTRKSQWMLNIISDKVSRWQSDNRQGMAILINLSCVTCRTKSFDQLYLPDAQKRRIVDHLNAFMASRDKYVQYGKPYKTTILLYGPPRTGKTSLAFAIATHCGIQRVSYLSLNCSRTGFYSQITGLMSGSVVLIDDIDAQGVSLNREKVDSDKVTTADVLSVLDGNLVDRNIVFVITSNNPGAIDPALLNTGRVDLRELIDLIGPDDQGLMAKQYGFDGFVGVDEKISPCSLQEALFKSNTTADILPNLLDISQQLATLDSYTYVTKPVAVIKESLVPGEI